MPSLSPIRRVLAAALAVLTVASGAIAPTARAAPIATHFRLALTTPPQLGDLATVATDDRYVILQAWESALARRLHAANPHLTVLVYQNLGSMTQSIGPDGLLSSGVSYAQARGAHPDWFLTTTSGAPVRESGFPYLWMANVGNRGYQRRWTDDVTALLRRGPWDGVFVDDVNASPYPESGDVALRGYADAAAYRRAVGAMLAYVAPRVHAAGGLEIANIGEWSQAPGTVTGWLRHLGGAMDEQFVKVSTVPGQGYRDAAGWRGQLREVRTTEALGKSFLAVTAAAGHDTSAQVYGWASLLLAADGRASYLSAPGYTGAAPAPAAYATAIGVPHGPMRALPGGAWERRFTHGLVVVNPTTEPVSVRFGVAFSGEGLRHARSARLAAHTGLVLSGPRPSSRPPLKLVWVVVAVLAALAVLIWLRRRWRPAPEPPPDR